MKFLFFNLIFCTLLFTYKYPVLPKAGLKAESFVPKGWHILEKAEGDLNKDNLRDLAVVIETVKPVKNLKEPEVEVPPRILFVALQQVDGSYQLSVQSNESVFLSNEGGIFGDPWAGMTIERGTLLVQFYAGSSDRWAYDYRWRFQNNDWFLIGATYTGSSTHDGSFKKYDFNLSTGAAELTVGKEAEDEKTKNPKDKVSRFTVGKKPLFKLNTFKPGQYAIYKDIYI
ncbi:MAG: hypothetical protein U0X91_05715 [Spirosomataceae bacterium]